MCLLFILANRSSSAQLVINEFLASNTGITIDPDYNESSDWIELFNAGDTDIDLTGYFLTDNLKQKDKWTFPFQTLVPAKSYLIVWTDGFDAGLHCNFKLSADGEEIGLYDPDTVLIDTLSYRLQGRNISMGRSDDAATTWHFFTTPTPGSTNNTTAFEGLVKNKPVFEPLGGFFTGTVHLSLKNTFGGDIRYTTDGSEPDSNSTLYTSPIDINETSIIRARIYKQDMIPGDVITHSYFIDNAIGDLPVVSIATDPDNFWDPVNGIYVQDFKPDWEVPVNVELFENDGSDRAAFNERAGTKVNGLYSWRLPQKMLGIYFRKAYGEGKLEYTLFTDRPRNQFDSFALRASGSDWSYTLFRDAMMQELTSLNTDLDRQGYKPCAVYVNGEYMGIHNIRSKTDEEIITNNYDLPSGSIDMIENEEYAEAGSLDLYEDFMSLYNQNLYNNANYDAVKEVMDLENFTDFIITEIFVRNSSLDHNVMAWKPKEGGKWRWILMDLDRGFFNPTSSMIGYFMDEGTTPFRDLMDNDAYRRYFGLRLADQFFTSFNAGRVNRIIDEFKWRLENEIPKHIDRWQGTTSNYGDAMPSVEYWENEIDDLKSFTGLRVSAILGDLVNYGFNPSAPLSVITEPANGGTVTFNGLIIDHSPNNGYYPLNETFILQAQAKSAYKFLGWKKPELVTVFSLDEVWKYKDTGVDLGSDWKESDYDDAAWASGEAELGYGDGDETTVVNYTGGSNNKNITTYFRRTFALSNKDQIESLRLNLKCDDGAVLYLNGQEIYRENLPSGNIDSNTRALISIGGASEDEYTTYYFSTDALVSGSNVMAVEIHQNSPSSSDISFNMSLEAFKNLDSNYYSTDNEIVVTQDGYVNIKAIFEPNGQCMLPAEISEDLLLSKSCSPYLVPEHVTIHKGAVLSIEPGVELWIDDSICITINGAIKADGTKDEPILFTSHPESGKHKWGILNFIDADSSSLSHVTIEHASRGDYALKNSAAISAFNSVLSLDHITLENNHANPITARYSDIRLTNSMLHSDITGDLINVKYGKGYINNCTFKGNDQPDTDAIDYDDVSDGVIQNCVIHGFLGFNSDAIDIGEQCQNVHIDSVFVYNITDKGVSVGQQSSVTISQSVFANCNLGAGLKDSSHVSIDHCTYYGVGTAIACYEKNPGDAGGNAIVTSTILSNTYDQTILVDHYSTLDISYSQSDNDTLPDNANNYFMDPILNDPNTFNLALSHYSPCFNKGLSGDIGANTFFSPVEGQPYISRVMYNSDASAEEVEYLVIRNSGSHTIDLSGYKISKGVSFTFPKNTTLGSYEALIITNNTNLDFWSGNSKPLLQWESGRLANEGETIRLESPNGIISDQVKYANTYPWPIITSSEGIMLASDNLDNHFGKNWVSYSNKTWVGLDSKRNMSIHEVYPNPTTGLITITGIATSQLVEIYSITGKLLQSVQSSATKTQLDLSDLPQGVYLIKAGRFQQKIVLVK